MRPWSIIMSWNPNDVAWTNSWIWQWGISTQFLMKRMKFLKYNLYEALIHHYEPEYNQDSMTTSISIWQQGKNSRPTVNRLKWYQRKFSEIICLQHLPQIKKKQFLCQMFSPILSKKLTFFTIFHND